MTAPSYGIGLSFDDELREGVEEAQSKRTLLVLTGDMYAGKTWGVERVQSSKPNRLPHVQLSVNDLDDGDQLRSRVGGQAPLIVEGTHYQLEFLYSAADCKIYRSRSPLANFKTWSDRVSRFLELHSRKEAQDPVPSGIAHRTVNAHLTENDIDRLFIYYASKVEKRHPSQQCYSVNALTQKKHRYLSICSWRGEPGTPADHTQFLIPSLLEGVLEAHATRDEDGLREIERSEREKEGFALALLGIEGLTVGSDFLRGLGKVGGALGPKLMLLGPLVPPLEIAGLVLLGASSLVTLGGTKRGAGFGQYIDLWKKWNALAVEKQRALTSGLDEKFRLPPNSSFMFLNNWLGKNQKEKDFKKLLGEIFPDEILDKVREVIADFPELKDEVQRHGQLLAQQGQTLAEYDRRLAALEQSPVAQPLNSVDDLRDELGLVGSNPRLNSSLKSKVNEILELANDSKPRKIVVLGEPGIGKSTLVYIACERLLAQGRKLYGKSAVGLNHSSVLVVENATGWAWMDEFVKGGKAPFTIIATSRTREWNSRTKLAWPDAWQEVALTPNDFGEETLRNILLDLLTRDGVPSTERGVFEAVRKSEGVPVYLKALVEWLKSSEQPRTLDHDTASKAPPKRASAHCGRSQVTCRRAGQCNHRRPLCSCEVSPLSTTGRPNQEGPQSRWNCRNSILRPALTWRRLLQSTAYDLL